MSSSPVTEVLRRFDASQGPRKLGPDEGEYTDLLAIGVRFMVWTEESGGGFSLVEHPIPPRTLAAPLHLHTREDEYSFVIEGRMGALLGNDVIVAETGELAFKPRGQWHTFWNAGDEPCRILEIISPGGFEHFFKELGALANPQPEEIAELAAHYGHYFDIEGTRPGDRGARAQVPAAGAAGLKPDEDRRVHRSLPNGLEGFAGAPARPLLK
jgi:mannose-6-phosphate isomerase-like protein (cupin superfamily)